jgi:uncharacterized membrane protein YdfJ with MMPL/SSD domain
VAAARYTTVGVVFGITMFALMASTVEPVAQTGLTIGIGLLVDTLIIRTFLMPSRVAGPLVLVARYVAGGSRSSRVS